MKSTSWTKIYLSLAKTQQGQLSLNLPDIHLSLINPLVCQMKVSFCRLLSESLGLLPFSSREVDSWAIQPHARVAKGTENPVVRV